MAEKDEKAEKTEAGGKNHPDDNNKDENHSFKFKVNGVEISTPHQKLVSHDVLELAEKKGAIPRKPEDYVLQGDKGQYGWDDGVDLEEDNLFITIPTGSTPVA